MSGRQTDWVDYESMRLQREEDARAFADGREAERRGYLRALEDVRVMMRVDHAAHRLVIDIERLRDNAAMGNPAAVELLRVEIWEKS